jgi:hypothetical protein
VVVVTLPPAPAGAEKVVHGNGPNSPQKWILYHLYHFLARTPRTLRMRPSGRRRTRRHGGKSRRGYPRGLGSPRRSGRRGNRPAGPHPGEPRAGGRRAGLAGSIRPSNRH